ncbi:uncharacterized protein LOC131638233 [Vicia villosa]|uniref:uncharacterized protein LOC131638233 n=1 Tax=Vicia villosa TaxID=3911 RepID=UPI00273A9EAC|nr:uncharacterized protein LOC131638233 [Vicia villosa]
MNLVPENGCCAKLNRKYCKLQESRNALRGAVNLLEQTVNKFEAQNESLKKAYQEESDRAKIEKEQKLKEFNAKVLLENEVSALKFEIITLQRKYDAVAQEEHEDVESLEADISDKEKEIDRLKKLVEKEKQRADSERKAAENEVSALKAEISALQQKCGTTAQEENENVKALKADICDKEKEIDRLKKLKEKEKKRADSERKAAENEVSALKAEISALQQKCGTNAQEENENVKALKTNISNKEKENDRLKKLMEKEKKMADSERKVAENEVSALKAEISALQQKCVTVAQEENDNNAMKADISDKEKEIDKLKKLVEKEKKRADSERKVAENEVSALKSEINVLQQKCGTVTQEENENKALKADISDKEKEIDRLKTLVEKEKKRADSERKVAENEVSALKSEINVLQQKCGTVAQEENENKVLKADISDKEKEIDRLKKLVEKDKKMADSERMVAENEVSALKAKINTLQQKCCAIAQEENEDVKALKADLSDKEKEIDRLKKLVEKEKKMADSARKVAENEVSALKSEINALQLKCGTIAQEENEDVNALKADISEKEKEIDRLKKLVEKEKKKADSERKVTENEKKKAAEACKLLEAEKKISLNKGMQLSKIEAEKVEEYRLQQVHLEKEVTETKMKLASELLKFKEASKRVEAEKQKLLVEKRNAESKMKKAQEQVGIEKQKAVREKRRADEEHVKVEEQKRLAQDNWKSAKEAKHLADQRSQELLENKKTIEDLKQKIHELSSLRKPTEISGVSSNVNAESDKIQLLKSNLELEKLRAKHAREKLKHERKKFEHERMKFKYEESCRNILQQELHRLKLDCIKNYNHLTMLDASFSPVAGGIQGPAKCQNMPSIQKPDVMTQLCNLGMPQMHSCVEKELTKPCSVRVGACDSLRKSMQNPPLLAISEGNYTEPITGTGYKLEPLIGGSNRTSIQSYALNSSTASFSDAHLMGSQERGALQVTTSTKSAEENFNARSSMLKPFDRSVICHDGIRNRISDTIECVANLSSEGKKLNTQLEDKLSDLCGLLYDKINESGEGGREMATNHRDNLQAESDRPHKKRKKSHREKEHTPVDEKKKAEDPKAGVYEDADGFRQTTCPALYTQTTQTCRERIFDEIYSGNAMKLLDLENAVDEECYRRAMNAPLSPLSLEICLHTDFSGQSSLNMEPFQDKVLHTDLLNQRDLSPSTRCDVIDVEMNSNMQKFDAFTVPCNGDKSKQAIPTDVTLQETHSLENLKDTSLADTGNGSLHNQFPNSCLIVSDRDDNSSISRKLLATRNCIARCSLDTQTGWEVASILTAVDMEEISPQKEKLSVLLTLLLFNFTKTAMKFSGGNLIHCLNSYAEHICRVLADADTRILLLEKNSLLELLRLIEDFLIEGKVIVPTETPSDSNLRNDSFLDGVDTLCSKEATDEQLVAAGIILASICAATNYIGFLSEASYNILRLCRYDIFMALTILHIFANLGGKKYFDSCSFGLTVTVLKSLVMFLEGGSISVTPASCLPSINQLRTDLCTNVKCPFSEGAESIDAVTFLLLEKIKKHLFQEGQFDSSSFRSLSDNYNNGQCSNQDIVPCTDSISCDVSCCLKNQVACHTQPDVRIDVNFCQLSDILSLLELVSNKMGWQWTNTKLVPQLLHVLDSCVVENAAVAIIALLGQLGRFGVDAGGYEDQGIENLRSKLLSYLNNFSIKAGTSLQIAAATALFALLPLDLEAVLKNEFNLSAYSSKSISDDTEGLKKWFFGLAEHQRESLYGILKCTD